MGFCAGRPLCLIFYYTLRLLRSAPLMSSSLPDARVSTFLRNRLPSKIPLQLEHTEMLPQL